MDSIGATALNNPILDNSLVSEDSPVLSQKPIFFANDPLDPVTTEIEEWDPSDNLDDEFKMKVKQRKIQGFIGTEYTAEEAMSKQFGPERIEARAFLEYYWELKAKCLEAVEKKRNSDVHDFQMHPLFSPDWLVPSRRDIRWHLKNEIRNEENVVVKEESLNGPNSLTLREHGVGENSSSIKRPPATRDLGSPQRKSNESKKGIPIKIKREHGVGENSSSIKRFPATGRDLGSPQRKSSELKKGIPVKIKREHGVGKNSSSIKTSATHNVNQLSKKAMC
ncbi:unnamed protein product [Nezara viridula]|uniref:Uncharacterized protein n=1 Tax=Nezara viridula TaxID=85310 RepID=A0A9P0E4C0_NEZVI|nr:unnamed protein product [Nezara viridula]